MGLSLVALCGTVILGLIFTVLPCCALLQYGNPCMGTMNITITILAYALESTRLWFRIH